MVEIWKVYKKTQNFRWGGVVWEVSNYGNVKKNGVLYECDMSGYGYKKFAGVFLHKAVAELFIPNPENKKEVDHIDTDKLNNHVDNLRWTTRKENCNNILTKQHYSEAKKGKYTGENNPMYGKEAYNKHVGNKCIYNNIAFSCIKDAYDYAVKNCGYNKSYGTFRKTMNG